MEVIRVKSMTGFGRGTAADLRWEVSVELKSVNHRFLDIACRLPRNLAFLEDGMRKTLSAALSRGHVEVFITVKALGESMTQIRTDRALAAAYLSAAAELRELGAQGPLTEAELMAMEGVLLREDAAMDEEAVSALFAEACRRALDQLTGMRRREGESLTADLAAHLDQVAAIRESILALAPSVAENYRARLAARLEKLPIEPVDPARLAQEVAIFADRCAIDEELARLESHISQFRAMMQADGEVGKKLDFLIQEMNREANTIGSKANDAQVAQRAVALKSEIEKLREQVQNVE